MNNGKIRLLGIAPYDNLKYQMTELAVEYRNQIEITVFVGDLEEGVQKARYNYYNEYDAIVSRGGTARLLRERLDLPVIDIPITAYDIMRALKLAESSDKRYVLVGYPNITRNVSQFETIFQCKIESHTITAEEEVLSVLEAISDKENAVLLCDMISSKMAVSLGMSVILISSGQEAIRDAYEEAIQLCQSYPMIRKENAFLRDVISNQMNHTAILDVDGKMLFESKKHEEALVNYFLRKFPEIQMGEKFHFMKQINRISYDIKAYRNKISNLEYVAFYYTETVISSSEGRRGIRFVDKAEAEKSFREGVHVADGVIKQLTAQLGGKNCLDGRLLLWGDDGTCKEQVVEYLYSISSYSNQPFIVADCFLMNEKSWEFFISSHNSPLMAEGCTIYIKSLESLTEDKRNMLASTILASRVMSRNRLVLSCGSREGALHENGRYMVKTLGMIPFRVLGINMQRENIPEIARSYLSYLNTIDGKAVMGIEQGGLALLQDFNWSGNQTQFARILRELTMKTQGGIISEKTVHDILEKEKDMLQLKGTQADDNMLRININSSLQEMEKSIIEYVMNQENGNQSSTARKLGISRTTLWRLIKD